MDNYGVFGDRVRMTPGMNVLGTRFVNTESEAQDGQKTKLKSRLVAQGFKEIEKAQSDSTTANRESLRLFLSLSTILGFENLASLYVSAAFLQSDELTRKMYVRQPI